MTCGELMECDVDQGWCEDATQSTMMAALRNYPQSCPPDIYPIFCGAVKGKEVFAKEFQLFSQKAKA
jgi:hypothetical protein